MPTSTTQLTTTASADHAFAYLARFDDAKHRDPGVASAHAPGYGRPALGARPAGTEELGGGARGLIDMITACEASHRVVPVADGSTFVSHDEIPVAPQGDGARMTSRHRRTLTGLTKIGAPVAGRALRKAGARAIVGLTGELARLGG